MAGADSASAASASGQYNCKFPNLDLTFKDPWTVTLNANLPDSVETGASIPAPTITAHIVTGSDAADPLRGQDIVTGTSVADYTVAGQARKANLEVTGLPYMVPATGGVATDASGKGQAATAPPSPTSVDVVAGDFTASLTLKSGFVANITCTSANAAGIKVGSTDPSTSEPTDPAPTTTDPTTSEPATDPTTTVEPTAPTADEPTSATGSATSTAAPAPSGSSASPAGPVVSTDYINTNSTAGIAGLALTAAGFVALGGAVVAGRRGRS